MNAGTLQAGAANGSSSSSAVSVASGTTLDLNGFAQPSELARRAGSVTLGRATLTAGGDNSSTTFSGAIGGTGALVKAGSGTLTLTGANSYGGGTTVNAGTLAGTTTSLQGAIANNATVTFDQTTDGTYAGAMSGTRRAHQGRLGNADLDGGQQLSAAARR